MYTTCIIHFFFFLTIKLSSTLTILEEVNSSSYHYNELLLDGTNCDELSTGGSVLVSGIQTIMNNSLLSYTTDPHLAILSYRCITECRILQSTLSKFNDSYSAIILSINPRVYKTIDKVISLVPPGKSLADALFVLLKSLSWNRFGLITDYADTYTTNFIDYIIFKAKNVTIFPIINSYGNRRFNETIHQTLSLVEESGAKVLVILAQEALHLVCAAHQRGMRWPYYGWLVYGYNFTYIEMLPTCAGSHDHLEGTVFPTYYTSSINKTSLKDAAIQLLQNASDDATQSNITFKNALLTMAVPGINTTLGRIHEDTPAVHFIQIMNSTPSTVAMVYNGTVLHNEWYQEDELPNGRLPVVVNTVYPTWLGAVEVIVSGILITTTLLLYICYHNQPEVKATSWSLNLLMFLGCYLVLAYQILAIIRSEYPPSQSYNMCFLLYWLSGAGISLTLILAVILIKLVRIYRIFYLHDNKSKMCSDAALTVYVLLLLLPTIVILTVMTAHAPYQHSTLSIPHDNYTEELYICSGNLSPYFLILPFVQVFLIVSIVVVAIKTIKLRHGNFKDSKTVNILIFFILPSQIFTFIVYILSLNSGQYLSAYIALHISHCTLIALSLGFLFVPKIYPIVSRRYLIPIKLKFVAPYI